MIGDNQKYEQVGGGQSLGGEDPTKLNDGFSAPYTFGQAMRHGSFHGLQ